MTTEPKTKPSKPKHLNDDLYRKVYEQASKDCFDKMILEARGVFGLLEDEYDITHMGKGWRNDRKYCDFVTFGSKWVLHTKAIPAGSNVRDYFLITKKADQTSTYVPDVEANIKRYRETFNLPDNLYEVVYMGRGWNNGKNACDYIVDDGNGHYAHVGRIPDGTSNKHYYSVTRNDGIALTQAYYEAKLRQESPRPKGELHKQQQQQQQMNTAKYANTPVSTVTLVFGQDVSELSPDNCISLISRYQAVKKDLAKTLEGTSSTYLTRQVAEYDSAITTLVARLDRHAAPVAPAPAPEA